MPTSKEELLMYSAVLLLPISSNLVRDAYGVQYPVYYTSRALQGTESKYLCLEKLGYALITSVRRLRPYFQAHTIVVFTDQPLQRILSRLETSSRLIKWVFELEEFKVLYRPRTMIKGHVLEDFLVEFTYAK